MPRVESSEDVFLQAAIQRSMRTAEWAKRRGMPMEERIFSQKARKLKKELAAEQKNRVLGLLMQLGMGL